MIIDSHEIIIDSQTFHPVLRLTVVTPLSLLTEPQAVDHTELCQIIGTEFVEAWKRYKTHGENLK